MGIIQMYAVQCWFFVIFLLIFMICVNLWRDNRNSIVLFKNSKIWSRFHEIISSFAVTKCFLFFSCCLNRPLGWIETYNKPYKLPLSTNPIVAYARTYLCHHPNLCNKTNVRFLSFQISRQSIDACKDYFRDDLLKSDWALMVELKKLFQIL